MLALTSLPNQSSDTASDIQCYCVIWMNVYHLPHRRLPHRHFSTIDTEHITPRRSNSFVLAKSST